MPIVIVPDGLLWKANYKVDGSGFQNLEPTDYCSYYLGHLMKIGIPFVLTHIHFVTCTGLSELLQDFLTNRKHHWDEIFHRDATPL
jgi:hypothetical protein